MNNLPKTTELFSHTIEGLYDLDLDQTFDCGQCFRFRREGNGSYSGIVYGGFANVCMHGDKLVIWSNILSENSKLRDKFWREYFDLDTDYSQIRNRLSDASDFMKLAIKYGAGIHILNQEKWETLISFIISQNNNIPRIKACIEKLCECFGEVIGKFYGRPLYAFPSANVLADLTEDDLRPCRLGYRAQYIIETARKVVFDRTAVLSIGDQMKSSEIEQYLRSLPGVGPKVAHCIMLFSMKKSQIFPIDIWVRRAMNRAFAIDENDVVAMREYADEHFGEYGGIAQQYLFYYFRERGGLADGDS